MWQTLRSFPTGIAYYKNVVNNYNISHGKKAEAFVRKLVYSHRMVYHVAQPSIDEERLTAKSSIHKQSPQKRAISQVCFMNVVSWTSDG